MKYNTEEIFKLYNEIGTYAGTAKELGMCPKTIRRHVNSYHENNSFMSEQATRTGIPFSRVSHYWLKTRNKEGDDVSVFVKNKQEEMEYDELRDKLVNDLKEYSPHVSQFVRKENLNKNKNLLVIDPADVHIGKLALTNETGNDEYNIDIAISRVIAGTQDILSKSEPFGIEHIVIVVGNDILHIDNQARTTTGGTRQDTDSQWWDMFESARRMYVEIIELAKEKANVTLIYCPSNHDSTLGFGLMDSLYSWYHNDANVNVSEYAKSQRHRKYIRYGVNLIGFTHGDGAKNKDLTSLMQYEAKQDWAEAMYAYWYVHHFHHKYRIVDGLQVEKDNIGVTIIGPTTTRPRKEMVTVECIRSPSPADSWHAKSGYVNDTAIEGFIHNITEGQIARITSYC